jgi:hypothetical protein
MALNMRLAEIIPAEMLEANREHIIDFLLMEGVTPDPDDLGATELGERKLKELLGELADGL